MAKKKSRAIRKGKVIVKAPVVELKAAEPVKKNNNLVFIVLAIILLITAVETYFVSVTNIRQSKKPVYVTGWDSLYKGYNASGIYGNYLYVTELDNGDVYKNDKSNGTLVKMLSFPDGAFRAVADSKDNMYILTKKGDVLEVDGNTYKTIRTIKPSGMQNADWMDIDSKDNFYLASGVTNQIAKYGPDFTKILSFGGPTEDKSSLIGLGKIFIGPEDNIYAMNSFKQGGIEIKIFDNKGKFIRSWPITNIKAFDSLTQAVIVSNGDVYINSYTAGRVYAFTGSGKFLGSFDSDKTGKFQIINGAASLTGGKDGELYIFSHRIDVVKSINY